MPDTAEFTGPSPKRRRTERPDNRTPAAISEQIHQTNATLSHITGQRHNRWMQGFVSGDGSACNTASDSDRTTNRQTGGKSTSVNTEAAARETHAENTRRQDSHIAGRSVASHAGQRRSVEMEGATESVPAGNPAIVDYLSPTLETARTTIATAEHGATLHTPGLPSPAPSDENTSSPMTATASTTWQPPLKRPRGRPRKHPLSDQQQQQMPPPSPSASAAEGMRAQATSVPAQRSCLPRSPLSRGQNPTSASPQPALSAMPSSPAALRTLIDHFEKTHPLTSQQDVDKGRLQLLREAASPAGTDWFYLVLSQVHALRSSQPGTLPKELQSLPPQSWGMIDNLICSNSQIHPNLLAWLGTFPLPMTLISQYDDSAKGFNGHVNAVVKFMRNLPEKWNRLEAYCRGAFSPPLAQDLWQFLQTDSGVLQTIAFRAAARAIWQDPNDNQCLDYIERLHKLDQAAWKCGLMRQQASERHEVYNAFRRVRANFHEWLHASRRHQAIQQTLPPQSRTLFQEFTPEQCAPDALAVLQTPLQRLGVTFRTPSQAPQVPQRMTPQARPQQQQRAVSMDERRLINVSGGHFSSPSTVNTVPAQTPTNNVRPRAVAFQPVVMPPQRHPQGTKWLLFPHENDGPPPQLVEPNPMRSALHQAHLRSPVPIAAQIDGQTPQLYRYVKSHYPLPPTRLNKDISTNLIVFDLPQKQYDKIPRPTPSAEPGELPTQLLTEDSQTYRLRCCPITPKGFVKESDWTLSDTHWPADMCLELNDHMLETRRPLHHKKFLPCDLTPFIRPGENTLKVIILRTTTDKRPFDFAVAVETVGAIAHSTLVSNLHTTQSIPAAETLASIKQSLSGADTTTNDDDDLAITSTSMTIQLFDPFSASRIFTTPVRGADCRHKDCLDLETFLSQCRRAAGPDTPTVVDCWRCPICRGDVRPGVMRRDEWMVGVRKTLEGRGELGTRAIVVEGDGKWRGKREVREGVRSGSLEVEEGVGGGVEGGRAKAVVTPVPVAGGQQRRTAPPVEVIEID